MLIFNKILPVLLLPLGFTLSLLLLGLLWRKRGLLSVGVISLFFFSTPLVSDFLMSAVEGPLGRVPAAELHSGDAVVVLGGMLHPLDGAPLGEWNDAVDRFDGALELFKSRKAPVIVFTRGQIPWRSEDISEGELLAKRARLLGVPQKSILLTGVVGNTADEAVAAAKLLGVSKQTPKRIILVTSAFHMRRAVMLFEHEGFLVEPFRVDYRGSGQSGLLTLVPDAAALEQSQTALREVIGWAFYWGKAMVLYGKS